MHNTRLTLLIMEGRRGCKGTGKGATRMDNAQTWRHGDWACRVCQVHVFQVRNTCFKCGGSRKEVEMKDLGKIDPLSMAGKSLAKMRRELSRAEQEVEWDRWKAQQAEWEEGPRSATPPPKPPTIDYGGSPGARSTGATPWAKNRVLEREQGIAPTPWGEEVAGRKVRLAPAVVVTGETPTGGWPRSPTPVGPAAERRGRTQSRSASRGGAGTGEIARPPQARLGSLLEDVARGRWSRREIEAVSRRRNVKTPTPPRSQSQNPAGNAGSRDCSHNRDYSPASRSLSPRSHSEGREEPVAGWEERGLGGPQEVKKEKERKRRKHKRRGGSHSTRAVKVEPPGSSGSPSPTPVDQKRRKASSSHSTSWMLEGSWQAAEGRKEKEEKLQAGREAVAVEVAEMQARLDLLMVQPPQLLSDEQVLGLARKMQLTVNARGLDLVSYMDQYGMDQSWATRHH